MLSKTKECSRCNEVKPLTTEHFKPRKDSVDGFRGQCASCQAELKRKWYEEVTLPKRRERSRIRKEKESVLMNERFLRRLKTQNQNDVSVLEPYIKTDRHVKVRFNDCGHMRNMTPRKLMQGQGCGHKECMARKISEAKLNKRRKTIVNEFANVGYKLLGEFNGTTEMVRVLNNECGHTYEANANNVLNKGSGCPVCHGMKDTGLFKKQIEQMYPREYDVLGEYVNNRTDIKVVHKECGHVWKVTPKSLMRDRVCPGCNYSKGERYIKDLLTNKKVEFEQEVRFDDCRYINPLPFDFAVQVDGRTRLIEFDGSQHFGHSNFWGEDNFDSIQRNDGIKNAYCIDNDIPLLRIPYWQLRSNVIDERIRRFIN